MLKCICRISHIKESFVIIFILIFCSCSDIFDEPMDPGDLILIAPSNDVVTTIEEQYFTWQRIDEASSYQLSIATPSFDYIVKLELDTFLTRNYFSVVLLPNEYEWKVCAKNNANTICSEVYRLTILSSDNDSLGIK